MTFAALILAPMAAQAPVHAAPPASPVPAALTAGGTAMIREKILLPKGASLVVTIEDLTPGSRRPVASSFMALGSRQSPLPFTIAYEPSAFKQGVKYGLTAAIMLGDQKLWAAPEPAGFVPLSKRAYPLTLVKVPPAVRVGFTDKIWELIEIDGQRFSRTGRTVSLYLSGADGRLEGVGGVNSFSGTWSQSAGQIQLDPGAMTLMAGPEDAMLVERKFIERLQTANRITAGGSTMTLYRGEAPLLRFQLKAEGSRS